MDILWKWEMPKVGNMDLFKNCYRLILTSGGEMLANTKADITIPTSAEMRLVRSNRIKTTKERKKNKWKNYREFRDKYLERDFNNRCETVWTHFKREIRQSPTEASECETERKIPTKKTKIKMGMTSWG